MANGFPRFSLGVQQVINDRTGKTVGNLHERRVGVTYQTNIVGAVANDGIRKQCEFAH